MRVKFLKRRDVLQAAVASTVLSAPMIARAQATDIKIGVIAPLTGPYAHQGTFLKDGIVMAAQDINAAGGVAKLGGRKINLISRTRGLAWKLHAMQPRN